MQLGMRKISIRKKTILLGAVFFVSLFFGTEVLAGTCLGQPEWNGRENPANPCTVDINYSDPCLSGECSGLGECWYKIEHSTQGIILNWTKDNCTGPTYTKVFNAGLSGSYCTVSGVCTFYGYAVDTAGNSGSQVSQAYNFDLNKPTTTINSPEAGSCHQSGSFNVSISDSDTGGSGLDTGQCGFRVISYDGGTPTVTREGSRTCNSSIALTVGSTGDCRNEGTNSCRIVAWSKDYAENQSDNATRDFSIDVTDPYQVSWTPTSRTCSGASSDISVTVQYADDGCGMQNTKYCWTTGSSCTPTTNFSNTWGGIASQSLTGQWTLCVAATDVAGNTVTDCKGTYIVDKDPPPAPSRNPDSRDWDNTDVSVIVTYTDDVCGISYTRHCWTELARVQTENGRFVQGPETELATGQAFTVLDKEPTRLIKTILIRLAGRLLAGVALTPEAISM